MDARRAAARRRQSGAAGIAMLVFFIFLGQPGIARPLAGVAQLGPGVAQLGPGVAQLGYGGKLDKPLQSLRKMPFDLKDGRCNRDALEAAMKKGVGAAAFGALIGGAIGRAMDSVDQHCVGQILEHVSDGRYIAWQNSGNRARYWVRPTTTLQDETGEYCRAYTGSGVIAGEGHSMRGWACRRPDGSWEKLG